MLTTCKAYNLSVLSLLSQFYANLTYENNHVMKCKICLKHLCSILRQNWCHQEKPLIDESANQMCNFSCEMPFLDPISDAWVFSWQAGDFCWGTGDAIFETTMALQTQVFYIPWKGMNIMHLPSKCKADKTLSSILGTATHAKVWFKQINILEICITTKCTICGIL